MSAGRTSVFVFVCICLCVFVCISVCVCVILGSARFSQPKRLRLSKSMLPDEFFNGSFEHSQYENELFPIHLFVHENPVYAYFADYQNIHVSPYYNGYNYSVDSGFFARNTNIIHIVCFKFRFCYADIVLFVYHLSLQNVRTLEWITLRWTENICVILSMVNVCLHVTI